MKIRIQARDYLFSSSSSHHKKRVKEVIFFSKLLSCGCWLAVKLKCTCVFQMFWGIQETTLIFPHESESNPTGYRLAYDLKAAPRVKKKRKEKIFVRVFLFQESMVQLHSDNLNSWSQSSLARFPDLRLSVFTRCFPKGKSFQFQEVFKLKYLAY